MKRLLLWCLTLILLIAIGAVTLYYYLPVKRVDITSELIMLGDINGDREWNRLDESLLADILDLPFHNDSLSLQLIDVNRNDAVDLHDLMILGRLYSESDPYTALEQAQGEGLPFPRPRELFKYLPRTEYVSRPVFTLPHDVSGISPLKFLHDFRISSQETPYKRRLLQEVYDEALRFSFSWEHREPELTDRERTYAEQKLAHCDSMYVNGRYFDLLIHLIELVEDAETLTEVGQSVFIRRILYFRVSLKQILSSPEFNEFESGERT